MPDYRSIYNEIFSQQENYNRAESSPGFVNCLKAFSRLMMLQGKALDVGCGAGFVCQLLARRPLHLDVYGVDISDEAIARTQARFPRSTSSEAGRFQRIESGTLPFDDQTFVLVTCFDVLEHLDVPDIQQLAAEIGRVIRRGGQFFGSVSCRLSGSVDRTGDNLHRTVQGPEWWMNLLQPDEATFEAHDSQLVFWKRAVAPRR